MKKRILSLLLAAAMVLSMLPTAFAEEAADPLYETVIEEENEMTEEAVPAAPEESYVAWLDTDDELDYSNVVAWNDTDNDGVIDSEETTYATLYDSLNAGGEVKLYRDYDASAEGYIEVGGDEHVTVVLDLNGKELAFNDTSAIDIFAASVTLRDSDGYGSVTTEGESAISCNEEAMLIIADGIMISSIVSTRFDNSMETEITEYGEAIDVTGGRVIIEDGWFHGDISVSGGDVTIESGRFYKKIFVSGGTLTILDGRFEDGWQSFGGLIVTGGEVFIEGGAFVGESNRVSISGGSVTISGGTFNSKDYYAVMTGGDGTLLITDGDFTGGSEFGHGAAHFAGDSTVIIEGGTFIGAAYGIYVDGADVSTYGGTFDGDTAAYAAEGSAVAIFDGTFSATVYGFCAYGANVNIDGGVFDGDIAAYFVNGSTVTISDGVFSGTFGGIQVDGADVSISGGSYSSDPSDYVAEEYVVTEDAETGMWTVAEAAGEPDYSNVVAWLDTDNDGVIDEDESTFEMLADAFAAVADATVEDNAIIKMNADVDLGGNSLTIKSGVFTLDLNGKTIGSTSTVFSISRGVVTIEDTSPSKVGAVMGLTGLVVYGGSVTVSGGTIAGSSEGINVLNGGRVVISGGIVSGLYGMNVWSDCSVTIADGTIIGTTYGIGGWACNVTVNGGTVNGGDGVQMDGGYLYVNGGTISGNSYSGVLANENCNVYITGGAISGEIYGVDIQNYCKLTIMGGMINGIEQDVSINGDCSVTITGGSFGSDPTEFLSKGYIASKDSESDMWVVVLEKAEPGTTDSPDGENLFANGSFEIVTDGKPDSMYTKFFDDTGSLVDAWGIVTTLEAENVYDGNYAIKIDVPWMTAAYVAMSAQVEPGVTYQASYFAKGSCDQNLGIEIQCFGNAGSLHQYCTTEGVSVQKNEWVKCTFQFVAPEDASTVEMLVWIPWTVATVYFDRFELRKEGEAITPETPDYSDVVAWNDTDNDGEIDGSETTYTTLYDALNAGGEVKLYQDYDASAEGSVKVGFLANPPIEITLDLNGKMITSDAVEILDINNAVFTVNDSVGGGGFVTTGSTALFCSSKKASLTINAGTFEAKNYALSTVYAEVTINGGTFVSTAGNAVNIRGHGNLTITDGSFSSEFYAVYVEDSTVTISGGTLESLSSYGIAVVSGSAEIFGGEFSGRSAVAYIYGSTLAITGGTFTAATKIMFSLRDVAEVLITGGSFNTDPSAYVAEGHAALLNSETGYYDVQEGTAGVKITAQPEDYVGMVGDTVKFVVAAEGEGLTYQWYYFDAAKQKWMKSSSTEAALAVEFKAYRNGQQYKCVITDSEGNMVETDVVSILAEEMELVIYEQPVSHVGAVNDNVLFYVGAEGNGLVYQWYYSTDGGENWQKSYSPGYDTNALEPILRAYRNGQQYYCQITDVFGNEVLSDVVDMTVRSSEVVIVKQPETVEYGVLNQLHYFTVEAEGDNLTYQWEVSMNGGETWEKSYNSGYDTAELTVRMYGYRSGYLYRCVITSGLQNTVITDEVALNLQPASVQIVSEPVSCGYVAQKNVNFHVEVEGMDLTYQWYRSNDGGNTWVKTYLDGYDTDTLYFKATAARCAVYRCIITDGSGKEAYSKAAKLTLIEKELVLLRQPEDMYCQNGDTAVFALEAEGAGLKYQWYASGDGGESWTVTYLGGSDTDTLSFKVNETRAAKLYKCVITDAGNNTVETQPVSAVIGTVERYEARIQPIYFNGEYTWRYDMTLTNNSNYDATLKQITILKRLDGNVVDKRVFTFSMTGTTIPLVLAPGESYTDNDGIPMVTEYDCIEYYFTLRNTAGEQKIVVYSYSLDSELPEIFRTDAVEAPFNNGFEDRWQFEIELENNGKQELALEQVLVLKKQGGEDGALVAVHDFKEEQLKNLGLNGLTLQPGENYMWGDGHPVVDEFDFMQYVFNFVNEEGRREIQIFSFDLLREAEADSDLVKPRWNGVEYDWRFQMPLTNESDSVLEVKRLIIDKRDGDENGTPAGGGTFEQDDLMYGVVTLQPGETFVWDDGFPYRENVDYVEYLFVLCDAAGNETEISYEFRLSHELPEIEDDGLVKPQWNGMEYDWRFNMELVNEGDSALTLERLVVEKRQGGVNGVLVREYIHEAEGLQNIGLGDENGPMVLQPDGRWAWNDGHPVVDYFDFMGYTFTFRDEAGRLVEIVFEYPLSHELPEREYPSYADDHGHDLKTLRHDADYSVQVSDGVYWVPANALGSSNYTNAQIQQMLTEKPETKQDQVDTLYEALQLYQVGAFSASNDNIRVFQNGINWEHHKPGYHAVRTNTGCCATSANWLRYILDGDYEEIGYLATSQRDGSGHIFNYIKQGGWYYFVDLTHYRMDWVATAVESGDMNDYYRSDYVLGNIHKVQDVQDYVDYIQSTFNDPPGLMFLYTAENCLALDGIRVDDKEVIHYEKVPGVKLQVVFDDPADKLEYSFALWEGSYPDWWSEESFDFSVIR